MYQDRFVRGRSSRNYQKYILEDSYRIDKYVIKLRYSAIINQLMNSIVYPIDMIY
jgi:hypothetical protein